MAATFPAPVHIPAWKRLGLQLKNQQQPAEPNHCPKAIHAVKPRHEESIESPFHSQGTESRLPKDGERGGSSPARLGKRKAENSTLGDGENPWQKRLKEKAGKQNTSREAPSAAQAAEVTASSTNLALHDQKPQGDPNYRSKKGKNQDALSKKQRVSSENHVLDSNARSDNGDGRGALLSEGKGYTNSDSDQDNLHQSTETNDHQNHVIVSKSGNEKPSKSKTKPEVKRASIELTPTPNLTRRKSVTFTPDTKTADGNSASELFKAWAAQQKGPSADFTPSELAQFTPPPKVHPANDPLPAEKPGKKDLKKAKKAKKAEKAEKSKLNESITATDKVEDDPAKASSEEPSKPSKADLKAAKKTTKAAVVKADSAAYLDYLTRYHTSRETWKFNKATQSNLLRDALNIYRIPAEYSPALKAYITGLQGAAARDRLHVAATAVLKEAGEVDEAEGMEILDDREARKVAHDDALRRRLQHTKSLIDSGRPLPNADDPKPKEQLTRKRAREILDALLDGAPAPAPAPAPVMQRPAPVIPHMQITNGVPKTIISKGAGTKTVFEDDDLPAPAPRPRARNRKRRTDVSDDDSSSSDESSDSDSSDSDSDPKQL